MEKVDTAPAQGGIQKGQSQFIKITTARQYRVMLELWKGPRCREDVDRIAGASNGPEVVAQLRRQGWDIPCELVPHIDRDGLPGKYGVYSLSSEDRLELREWLARREMMLQGGAV